LIVPVASDEIIVSSASKLPEASNEALLSLQAVSNVATAVANVIILILYIVLLF